MNPKLRNPNTVFTPRGDSITEMYIPRVGLEEKLKQYLAQPMHIVVHGESGCGKTWLYKKVFSDSGVLYKTVNLGRFSKDGINGILSEVLAKLDDKVLTEISESKDASVKAVIADAGISSQRTYEVRKEDNFDVLLRQLRKIAGKKPCALVFENLEHVLADESALAELKGLLLLLDDTEYARHQVRIILVTTASNLRTYLSTIENANTVINRIREVPEVGRLIPTQARSFIQKGLFNLLGVQAVGGADGSEDWFIDQIIIFSDRIPQYMHELCLEVAFATEASGRVLTRKILTTGVANWIKGSIISEMTAITSSLNSKSTKKGRRNQLLYAIAQCKDSEFDYQKIERIVRSEFPDACEGVKLNVSQMLSELASARIPIVRKVPNGSAYRISDPRYRILMRWMLYKSNGDESVCVREFDDGISLGEPA